MVKRLVDKQQDFEGYPLSLKATNEVEVEEVQCETEEEQRRQASQLSSVVSEVDLGPSGGEH